MFLTIIIFFVVLGVLVFVHELGHFLTARVLGIKAEEFGFGFPPRFFAYYRNKAGERKIVWGGKEIEDADNTIYSFNVFPLGGFVRIRGENGEGEDDPESFSSRKPWQKLAVISSGVTMNFILAAILLSTVFIVGAPVELGGKLGRSAVIAKKNIQVVEVLEGAPADLAGFKAGDRIISVDGTIFSTYNELKSYIESRAGEVLNYQIKRDKELLFLEASTAVLDDGAVGIGIVLVEAGTVKYPWYSALWQGFRNAAIFIWLIIIAFYNLIKNLILGAGVSADIAGPVGIANLTGQAARMGFGYLLQFSALLSLNLAVINFLPFPALDGGRALFIVIGKIFRRPVRKEIEGMIHYLGFALLMILVAIITFRDIVNLWK